MTRPTHRTARRTLAAVPLSAAALTGPAASATVVALPVTAGVTGAVVAAAPQAHAVAWDQVELVDDAGVIDLAQLRRDLAGIEFREPTRVAVVSTPADHSASATHLVSLRSHQGPFRPRGSDSR